MNESCKTHNLFHDVEVLIDNCEVIKQVCKRCGEVKVFYKDSVGRVIRSSEFLEFNKRDFIQPHEKEYEREYGVESVKAWAKAQYQGQEVKRKQSEHKQELSEAKAIKANMKKHKLTISR